MAASDAEVLEWIERHTTLHGCVELAYVVDGFQCTLLHDGNPVSEDYKGATLRDAIVLAMAENEWVRL